MKENTNQSHLIMSTNNTSELKVGDLLIKTSLCEKLLRDNHVANLCKKARNKLKALARATPYMTIYKKKLLMNSFFH